jgi:hypothetical protein
MADGTDWIWRPILRGVFKGESLFNGAITIAEIAQANDALDVQDENEARYHDANKSP